MAQVRVSGHPAILHKLRLLRAEDTPPPTFRALVGELAGLLAYEATADLRTEEAPVRTPLTTCTGHRLAETVALAPILRAGLAMVDGVLPLLPDAQVRHLGYFRDEESLQPVPYYQRLPGDARPADLCLVLDPMLATGGSAIAAIESLRAWGVRRIKFLGLLGAPEGVAALQQADPDVDVHLCAIDERLDARGFIVPGLGDAGDRQYNT